MNIKLCWIFALTFGTSVQAALAQEDLQADAIVAFQDICLRNDGQFEYAKFAAEGMQTAPEFLKSKLLRGREGEIWLSSRNPFVALQVLTNDSCGMNVKPAREDYLVEFLKAVPGQNIIQNHSHGTSWAKWYLINTDSIQGILSASVLDLHGEKSMDMKFVSAVVLNSDSQAPDYLMIDAQVVSQAIVELKKTQN